MKYTFCVIRYKEKGKRKREKGKGKKEKEKGKGKGKGILYLAKKTAMLCLVDRFPAQTGR